MLRLRDKPVDAVVFRDLASVVPAIGVHGRQVLQRTALPHGIHKFLQSFLELRGVESVFVVGPPSVIEALPAGAEVHAEVAHGAQCLVPLIVGIEKARLLNGSGPQVKWAASVGNFFVFSLDHLLLFCEHNQYHNLWRKSTEKGEKIQVICIPISGFGDSMICSRYLGSTTTSDSFLPLKKARMCSFGI